jgi:ParB family chromosome partitioning protein
MDSAETIVDMAPPRPPRPSPPPLSSAVELELRLLERAYAHLRIREPKATARQVATLASDEQHHPVLVVAREGGRYALIEGDDQVEALVRLGRDTVLALVLGLSEPEALSYCYRMQGWGRRSAVEEGWLVAELLGHDWGMAQIGVVLGRSVSWVSRRLGLVRLLPDKVAEAVRRGAVPAHGAMRSLLQLARANKAHCERLCERLDGARLSSRQLDALYAAWRAGDARQRERLVDSPLLFLKAKQTVAPTLPEGMAGELVRELDRARVALLRAGDAVVRAWSIDLGALSAAPVERALGRCTDAYEALLRHTEEPLAK